MYRETKTPKYRKRKKKQGRPTSGEQGMKTMAQFITTCESHKALCPSLRAPIHHQPAWPLSQPSRTSAGTGVTALFFTPFWRQQWRFPSTALTHTRPPRFGRFLSMTEVIVVGGGPLSTTLVCLERLNTHRAGRERERARPRRREEWGCVLMCQRPAYPQKKIGPLVKRQRQQPVSTMHAHKESERKASAKKKSEQG